MSSITKPICPDGWFAVYPCGSKLDLCASYEDRPVAFFEHQEKAVKFAIQHWPSFAEVLTSAEANAKPTTQAQECGWDRPS